MEIKTGGTTCFGPGFTVSSKLQEELIGALQLGGSFYTVVPAAAGYVLLRGPCGRLGRPGRLCVPIAHWEVLAAGAAEPDIWPQDI